MVYGHIKRKPVKIGICLVIYTCVKNVKNGLVMNIIMRDIVSVVLRQFK